VHHHDLSSEPPNCFGGAGNVLGLEVRQFHAGKKAHRCVGAKLVDLAAYFTHGIQVVWVVAEGVVRDRVGFVTVALGGSHHFLDREGSVTQDAVTMQID
jgi:hypothetical protein